MIDLRIEPAHRVSLVESVVERIRNVIEDSGLKPGNRIPGELELADRMNVSRSVVREAISRLQSIGLLTVVRGRSGGTFVGDQNTVMSYAKVVRSAMTVCEKDTKQFAGFRAALEIYSARRAAEIATDDDVAVLETLCDRIGDSDADDTATIADLDFHQKLAEVAGNEVILHTLQLSREFIKATIKKTGLRDPERSRMEHKAVVEAIRRRDPDLAERAMRRHMDSVILGLQSSDAT
jgi:GntR family transcriptional repressor for pyruvate dehydrogenase complex